MRKLLVLIAVLLLFPSIKAACVNPDDNLEIRENSAFCAGTYNLENGIRIVNNGVILDCGSSALIGSGIGYGILLKNANNASVENCNISNYEIGIYLDNSNSSIIKNNYLAKNKFGIASYNSLNNDANGNIFFDNINSNQVIYLPSAAIRQAEQARQEEMLTDAAQVIEEVIRIKKPFLKGDEILKEAEAILKRYFDITQQNLDIKRTIMYNQTDDSTRITLALKPKKTLLNASIYEKIPKCVSAYANEILFETAGYEVIKGDPLILWSFSRLDKERELSYRVFKSIGGECRNLLFAFGIAAGFEEFDNTKKKEEENFNNMFILVVIIILFIFLTLVKTKRK